MAFYQIILHWLLMNIIRNKKKYILLIFYINSILCIAYSRNFKNNNDSILFKFKSNIGLGYSTKISPKENLTDSYSKSGISGMARIYWGNTLNAGLEYDWFPLLKQEESNYKTFSGVANFSGYLNARSIFFIFLFESKGLSIFGGLGYNRISSNIRLLDQETINSEWFLGYNVGFGYDYPFSENYSIGAEIKTFIIPEFNYRVLAFQIKLNFNLLTIYK
jgi:opacity protein-like surface antigen